LPVIEITGDGEELTLITLTRIYKRNHLNPNYFSANPHEPGVAYRWNRDIESSEAPHGVLEEISSQEYAWEINGTP
jgi:hypothetical protein